MSKNSYEGLHRSVMWLRPIGGIAVVIEALMIPFAAYTTAKIPNAFYRVAQTRKLILLVGDLDPIWYIFS